MNWSRNRKDASAPPVIAAPRYRRSSFPYSLLATRYSLAGLAALAISALPAAAQEKPKYGGTVEIGTVYVTLSALSWDSHDWNWKHNHDTGNVYEQLFAADLSKSKANGGPHPFYADAWLPSDAIRGELAESWAWKDNPLRVEVKLRKGVMFPEKAGVMKARELVAQDVVDSYTRLANSPRKIKDYFDHLDKVEAADSHTVNFYFKHYFAEWDYRFGYGYFSGIYPKEVVAAGPNDWKNINGSGPFMLTEFVQGNSNTYARNPGYWDKLDLAGERMQLPFVDKIVYRTIKDEATYVTALRTGKLDILESIRWQNVENLKKTAPALKWSRWLSMSGTFLSFRVDQKPFDDVRVRRALNLAVNKQEIVSAYYNGNAELFGYPMHPDYAGYFEKLEEMPASIKELFTYDPKKARQLLDEAGVPKGFTFKVQVTTANPDHMELMPLIAAYLEQVGVKAEIQPMEYAAFLSAMTSRTHAPGYLMNNGHTNPTTTIRKSFTTGQQWNPSGWSDPEYDKKMEAVYREPDEKKRQAMLKAMTREILDKAPYIWLPTPYVYTAWWPWVKGYNGELRAGSVRPGPIYARLWVDQEMKKKMGY
jgi:peptide/nickel transport system substrate-binding protein